MAEFDLKDIKKKLLRKFPIFGSLIDSVKFKAVNDDFVNTAGTDGRKVYYNEEYLSSLTEDEQLFIFAHELCHIMLKHIQRSKDKDSRLWNIATDAVVNAYLQKEKLTMAEGGVDMKGAENFDAEEVYQKLKKEQEAQKNNNSKQSKDQGDGQGQNGQEQSENGQNEQNNSSNQDFNSHKLWEKALENLDESEMKNCDDVSEKALFEENKRQKSENAKKIMQKIASSQKLHSQTELTQIGEAGQESHSSVNWKRVLKRLFPDTEETWGTRHSDKYNGYMSRIEERMTDKKPKTQIILDVSSSVDVNLLKSFLRHIKLILRKSDIEVGTFSSEFHNDFRRIKKAEDIDNLKLEIGGGTNFNDASRAFSKDRNVNKICFTDGEDYGNAGIVDKRNDIVWICFRNRNFKPDYGKVIFVQENNIMNEKDDDNNEINM